MPRRHFYEFEAIMKRMEEETNDTGRNVIHINTIQRLLRDTPTVEAVPVVHGKWIEPSHSIVTSIGHIHYATCSSCRRTIALDDEFGNFCPNCGAKMDGKKVQE